MTRRSHLYDRAFSAVRSICNRHDPIGLVGLGCPIDEYDPEVADRVRLVLAPAPVDDRSVDDVWVRWFGEE